ncbi:MAG: YqgE/AlgH family protein [Pseudomonadota bacterium]
MENVNLTHHLLIAMPNMVDPHFSKAVVYVCEHNEQGALGLVINRPIDLTLQTLFEQIGISLNESAPRNAPVHFGGPVQVDRGFVLHQPVGHWQSTLSVQQQLGLTTSKDILQAVSEGRGPQRMLVTLGYTGWSPGQLEQEMAQNAWLSVAAQPDIMFDLPPEERLPAAMQLLGIDFASLSEDVGHA